MQIQICKPIVYVKTSTVNRMDTNANYLNLETHYLVNNMDISDTFRLQTESICNNVKMYEDLPNTSTRLDENCCDSVALKIESKRECAQLGSKLNHANNCKIIQNIYDNIQGLINNAKEIPNETDNSHRLDKKNGSQETEVDISKSELKATQVIEIEVIPTQENESKEESIKEDFDNADTFTDESDGLQEFLDVVAPKKRKRKPNQKRELTKEETETKERENLRKRTCNVCHMVFSIPKGLQNHMRVKHTFEKPYTCQLCGEKFSIQSTYALHRRRHLGIKPHLCNVCGKTFLRNTDLRIHMRTHDKLRDVECNLCSNAYNSVMSLKKHVLIKHTDPNEWKHECRICGKKCVSTTTLNLHIKQHNEDRSFKCHLCEKGFYTNQNLQVHIRTHSASTKFNCELCPNGYRSNEALQRHLLRMHGVGEEKMPSPPKFFCPICNDGFLQKARLEKHISLHETGDDEYPYKCELCLKEYKDQNFFTMHMKNKHNVTVDDSYFKERFSEGSDSGSNFDL